eukprot:Nitzschia sp. Nitz4//scaffold22_size323478//309069//310398//NITZ4_000594-RA/size323478-augustus-gene-0.253-mRNA-1//-1//CDS//3329543198//2284//frame0
MVRRSTMEKLLVASLIVLVQINLLSVSEAAETKQRPKREYPDASSSAALADIRRLLSKVQSSSPTPAPYYHPTPTFWDDDVVEHPIFDSESDFLEYCNAWFGTWPQGGSFLSQDVFVDFLVSTCGNIVHSELTLFDCLAPSFEAVPLAVQLIFVEDLCRSASNDILCLESLLSSGELFGYASVDSDHVSELCCNLLPFFEHDDMIQDGDCPETSSPVVSPSGSPLATSSPVQSGPTSPPAIVTPTTPPGANPTPSPSSILPPVPTTPTIPTEPTPSATNSPSGNPSPTILVPTIAPIGDTTKPSITTSPTITGAPSMTARPSLSARPDISGNTQSPSSSSPPQPTPRPTEIPGVHMPTPGSGPTAAPTESVDRSIGGNPRVSTGGIAGLAVGLGVLLVAGVYMASRRQEEDEDSSGAFS